MWIIRTLVPYKNQHNFKYYSIFNDATFMLALAKQYESEKEAVDQAFELFGFWEVCTCAKATKEDAEAFQHFTKLKNTGNLCT